MVRYILRKDQESASLVGFLIAAMEIYSFQSFSPVLLLSGKEFGLVDDCRHMPMEAGPLENCCEERKP